MMSSPAGQVERPEDEDVNGEHWKPGKLAENPGVYAEIWNIQESFSRAKVWGKWGNRRKTGKAAHFMFKQQLSESVSLVLTAGLLMTAVRVLPAADGCLNSDFRSSVFQQDVLNCEHI